MTVVIKTTCNGCGGELPHGPVAQLVRTNGLGGAHLPEPGEPFDWCLECAQTAVDATKARTTTRADATRYPSNRPNWLGRDQPYPCGRCGREEDDAEPHECVPVAVDAAAGASS